MVRVKLTNSSEGKQKNAKWCSSFEPAWLERWLIRTGRKVKSIARNFVPRDTLLFKFLKSSVDLLPQSEFQALLNSFARSSENVYFVQIGSADGVIGDPIRKFVKTSKWRGILVEPVPYLFEQLKQNYADDSERLTFENVAISNKEETRDFFYPALMESSSKLPIWYNQLGSFSRDLILKHEGAIPGLEDMLVKQPIECISLATLLSRNNVKRIDLLQIDTEGYDFEIVKQIDFSHFRPKVIIYEHKHLVPQDKSECASHLQDNGYGLVEDESGNTLAFTGQWTR